MSRKRNIYPCDTSLRKASTYNPERFKSDNNLGPWSSRGEHFLENGRKRNYDRIIKIENKERERSRDRDGITENKSAKQVDGCTRKRRHGGDLRHKLNLKRKRSSSPTIEKMSVTIPGNISDDKNVPLACTSIARETQFVKNETTRSLLKKVPGLIKRQVLSRLLKINARTEMQTNYPLDNPLQEFCSSTNENISNDKGCNTDSHNNKGFLSEKFSKADKGEIDDEWKHSANKNYNGANKIKNKAEKNNKDKYSNKKEQRKKLPEKIERVSLTKRKSEEVKEDICHGNKYKYETLKNAAQYSAVNKQPNEMEFEDSFQTATPNCMEMSNNMKINEREISLGLIGQSILYCFEENGNIKKKLKLMDIWDMLAKDVTEELNKIYTGYDPLLEFLENDARHVFQVEVDCVLFRPCLTICKEFTENKGDCSNTKCKNLHVCIFYLFSDKCPYKNCIYGHNYITNHNVQVLIHHFLIDEHLLETLKGVIFKPSERLPYLKPKICSFYNSNRQCSKPNCPFLHICKYFVQGACKFSPGCKRNHRFEESQPKKILQKYGLFELLDNSTVSLKDVVCNSLNNFLI